MKRAYPSSTAVHPFSETWLCAECQLPWVSGAGKCAHCFRTAANWKENSPSAAVDRPWFQYSLATLLQMVALACIQLTFFDVSLLVGLIALIVQTPALWRTIVAVQLNNKARGETPFEERILLYLYSLLLFGVTYGCVFAVGWLSCNVAGFCSTISERSSGHGIVGWVTPVIQDVAFFIVPFVLVVYAYGFLAWAWPCEKPAQPCTELEDAGSKRPLLD